MAQGAEQDTNRDLKLSFSPREIMCAKFPHSPLIICRSLAKFVPEVVEKALLEHILLLESLMFGLTITDVRKLAFQIAEQNHIPHNFNKQTQLAGKKWYYGFKTRHSELSLREPTATSLAQHSVSIETLSPIPKPKSKSKSENVGQKASILTSSPYKNQLELQKELKLTQEKVTALKEKLGKPTSKKVCIKKEKPGEKKIKNVKKNLGFHGKSASCLWVSG
ncbi:hypothetical protein J6590_089402 [Homalodisca vitripennis]|nr:hypothetical protein J6590_089402 [Homalodisca vitripennis]